MSIELTKDSIKINGQPHIILAGDIHYFRLNRGSWEDRLIKMKKAGLNAACTYVPWNWHEQREGEFDFTGEKDLGKFIEISKSLGLYQIIRPGPWICSEWKNGGIPSWLLEEHPEILCLDSGGHPARWTSSKAPPITYLHPTYLKHVSKWYDNVCAIIKDNLITKGGNIILVQADNEISFGFHRDPFGVDYNPLIIGDGNNLGAYQEWLQSRFKDISSLNQAYQTSYSDFSQVDPPRQLARSTSDLLRIMDWHDFKEDVIAEYLKKLVEMFRERQIDVPVFVNEPNIFEPPSNIRKKAVHALVGMDVFPFYIEDDRAAVYDFITPIKVLQARMPNYFLSAPEFQTGWIGDISQLVPVNTTHLLLRLGLAYGFKSFCHAMFVGGTNPDGYGTIGKSYDSGAPVSESGGLTGRYPIYIPFNNFVKTFEQELVSSQTSSDAAITYYYPYNRLLGAVGEGVQHVGDRIQHWDATLSFEASLYKVNLNPEFIDLQNISLEISANIKS